MRGMLGCGREGNVRGVDEKGNLAENLSCYKGT